MKGSCLTNVSKIYELSGNMRFTIVFLVLALAVMMTKALCPCPKIYNPVCANNGRTYSNPCLLECVVMEAKKQGDENAGA